jgi:predicted type IV restriction endonuclease
LKLRRDIFDPEDIGADARRKIFISAYVDTLDSVFRDPEERFVRTLMDMAGIEGRRMPRLLEEHTLYIREAMNTFFDKKLLERVGFADRNDIVKVPPAEAQPTPPAQESEQARSVESDIITTAAEMEAYEYVKHRLPFLIARDEDLFHKLDNIYFRDFRGTFAVSYKQDRKGRLLNF